MQPLLRFTDKGIYCPAGGFYVDPWRGVERAIITHAHSDHARWGSQYYLGHKHSYAMLKLRLGPDINLQVEDYYQPVYLNGVKVSFHPAGHIIGSAQVRIEHEGQVWVVSGDYKTENDGISGAFEPVPCHVFISESTFGLPVYRWKKQEEIFGGINSWWVKNKENNKTSMLLGYSLGKAQRLLQGIDKSIGRIFAHTAVHNVQQALIGSGIPVYPVQLWHPGIKAAPGDLVVAPPLALHSPWLKRFEPYSTAVCSGWMQVRGQQRRRNADAGFALSDHADWDGLLGAIRATGAQKVFITHGYQEVFSRYLNEIGIEAAEVQTEYGDEKTEEGEA